MLDLKLADVQVFINYKLMKSLLYKFASLLMCSTIFSCDSTIPPCIRPSSTTVTENRELKDFKGVVFNHAGDVILTQGPDYSFSIKGPDNVVELTNTKIENELLIISTNDCFNGNYDLEVFITSPVFNSISLEGVGSIVTNSQISGDIIEVNMLGLGDILADFSADSIYTTISGEGMVSYSGFVTKHSLSSSGVFNFKGFQMVTDYTLLDISGVGNCEVTANKSLAVTISGSGTVYYKGNPTIESDITGIGEVIDDN